MRIPPFLLVLASAAALRLNGATSYKLDTTFNPNLSGAIEQYGSVEALLFQPGGKILVGGAFSEADGVSRRGIARLNHDGSLDSTFDPGGGINAASVHRLVQTPRGIFVGGGFEYYDFGQQPCLVRIDANGATDYSFPNYISSSFSVHQIWDMRLAASGDLYFGGFFTHVNQDQRICFAALDAQDALSAINPRFNNGVIALGSDDQGRTLAGGGFTRIGSTTANRIARLNQGGSLDSSFDPALGPDDIVFSVAAQGGAIYIGGGFKTVQGVPRAGVARLNSDGTLDPSFNADVGGNIIYVFTIVPLASGDVMIGGYWNTIHGKAQPGIVRLRSDGTLDESLNFGSVDDGVNTIEFDENDNLYVGGYFRQIAGEQRRFLARFNPAVTERPVLQVSRTAQTIRISFQSSSNVSYKIQASPFAASGLWFDLSTLNGTGSVLTFQDSISPNKNIFYRVVAE